MIKKRKYNFVDCSVNSARIMSEEDIEKETDDMWTILTNTIHYKVYNKIVKKIMEREGLKR